MDLLGRVGGGDEQSPQGVDLEAEEEVELSLELSLGGRLGPDRTWLPRSSSLACIRAPEEVPLALPAALARTSSLPTMADADAGNMLNLLGGLNAARENCAEVEPSATLQGSDVVVATVANLPASGSPDAVGPAAELPASGSPIAVPPAANLPASGSPDAVGPAAKLLATENPVAVGPVAKLPASGSPDSVGPAAKLPASESPVVVGQVAKLLASGSPEAVGPAAKLPAIESPVAAGPASGSPSPGSSDGDGKVHEVIYNFSASPLRRVLCSDAHEVRAPATCDLDSNFRKSMRRLTPMTSLQRKKDGYVVEKGTLNIIRWPSPDTCHFCVKARLRPVTFTVLCLNLHGRGRRTNREILG